MRDAPGRAGGATTWPQDSRGVLQALVSAGCSLWQLGAVFPENVSGLSRVVENISRRKSVRLDSANPLARSLIDDSSQTISVRC
jgi:hypothetical protein